MTDSDEREHSNTKLGAIRHSILGVTALAVAALDFTIGTRNLIIAGCLALAVALYSFTKAFILRRSAKNEDRPR